MISKVNNTIIEKIKELIEHSDRAYRRFVIVESTEPLITGFILLLAGAFTEERAGITIQDAIKNRSANDVKFLIFTTVILIVLGWLISVCSRTLKYSSNP